MVKIQSIGDFSHYQISQLKKFGFLSLRNGYQYTSQKEKIIYVAIDRTNWSRINLFMVSVIWDKRAFPIYFKLLPKLGSSNIDEQQKLLSQVMPLFEKYKICVLGDREKCSSQT